MHQIESNPALANSIMYYGASLRGTRSYWKQRCCELLDMVDQIGTPSVFFTLSAADYHWPHLFKLITPGIDPLTLSDQQRMQIMHENPLLTAWFFKTRVNIFMKEFVDKFFKCKDAWMRYEWQWRGSPHIHGLLWLEGCPNTNDIESKTEDERKNILEYFDNLCSAMRPENVTQPEIHPCRKLFSEVEDRHLDLCQLLIYYIL